MIYRTSYNPIKDADLAELPSPVSQAYAPVWAVVNVADGIEDDVVHEEGRVRLEGDGEGEV